MNCTTTQTVTLSPPRSRPSSYTLPIISIIVSLACVCLVTSLAASYLRIPRSLGYSHGSVQSEPHRSIPTVKVEYGTSGERATSPNYGSHCDLCAQNWLFILAAGGRTGSTSALSMFSRIPGFELLGEHKGFLTSQRDAVEELKAARDFWITEVDSPSWRNSDVDMHSVHCNIQELVKRILLGRQYGQVAPKVLGFKEIRYTNMKMMPFLNAVFPCAKILITSRSTPPNTWSEASQPWVKYEPYEERARFLKKISKVFNGTSTALLPLETRSVGDYNKILHGMLGVRGCKFTQSLHDNAEGGYDADKRSDVIEGECDLSGVDFRLDEQTIQRNAALWAELQQSGEPDGA